MLRPALAVAVVVVLASCSSPPEPAPAEPAASSAPTVEPSTADPLADEAATSEAPPEPAPVMPPEAQAQDIYGAAAFIRFYFESLNYAYRTGDLTLTQSLRQDDCTACLGMEEDIQADRSKGVVDGASIIVTDVVVTPGDMSTFVEAAAVAYQEAGRITDLQGQVVDEFAASDKERVELNLERIDDAWIISQWGAPS